MANVECFPVYASSELRRTWGIKKIVIPRVVCSYELRCDVGCGEWAVDRFARSGQAARSLTSRDPREQHRHSHTYAHIHIFTHTSMCVYVRMYIHVRPCRVSQQSANARSNLLYVPHEVLKARAFYSQETFPDFLVFHVSCFSPLFRSPRYSCTTNLIQRA